MIRRHGTERTLMIDAREGVLLESGMRHKHTKHKKMQIVCLCTKEKYIK